MNIFLTADLHFGHKNIIQYENRPYKDIEEMDNSLINIWNNQVDNDDLVYILGDFSWYNANKTSEILKKLKGRKILIIGNHDCNFLNKKNFDKNLFEEIHPYLELRYNKKDIIMCHYPIIDWNNKNHGSYHFYGHVHSMDNEDTQYMTKLREKGFNCYNVGIDIHKKLVKLEDFI